MAIQWEARFSVGHAKIDEQHRQLLRHYNNFSEACGQARGKEEIVRLFAFLEGYVCEHFAEEEALMARHAYPKAPLHREAHQNLTRSLQELKAQLQGETAPLPVVIETGRMLMKWVFEHIAREDAALGAYLAVPA